jgi:AraC-like DNA-binding protein
VRQKQAPGIEAGTGISCSPLDYRGAARGARYEQWREEFGRQLMAVDFEPLAEGPIRRAVQAGALPGMRLARSTGTPLKFISTGANEDLVLILSSLSPVRVAMGSRSAELPARGVTLGDAAIAGAFGAQLRGGDYNALFFDRALLLRHCPDAESQVGTALACNPALWAVLDTYCKIATEQSVRFDAVAKQAVSRHLLDLATLILGGHKDDLDQARKRGLGAARLEAIKADVLSSIADPGLSVGAVAARHGIGSRYVQRLFERTGLSFTEFVLEQRLLEVARRLASPDHACRLISEIAYEAGFNDLSYFNLCFRRRFDTTPSDFRVESAGRAHSGS